MPYDRYGEWYDEESMGPPPEIIAEYTYEDMKRDAPPDYGEIIGSDNRIVSRKPGEDDFRTMGGNAPLPDYFSSGGYKGKPDDPHLDADVIYYPDEVHTKKEGGGWDIAKRTPPGKKPSDLDLSEMEFLKFAEPEIMKDATEFGKSLRKQWEDSIPYSDRVLMKPSEFSLKGAEIERLATNEKRNEMVGSLSYEFRRKRTLEDKERERAKKTPNEIELTDRALKGDPQAKAVLGEIQNKKAAVAREGRSTPQQTVFVDPGTGNPLVFDRSTGTYKPASVEGGGGVLPRPVNPSASERERGAAFDVLKSQLGRIKQDYKSNYVGLASGQLGRVTQFVDKDEAAFRQVILDVKDSLLRARSGAQINEQEYARLAKLVPDFTDSEAQFAGKMQSFEKSIDAFIEQRKEAQKKGGVKRSENGNMNSGSDKRLPGETITQYLKRTKR